MIVHARVTSAATRMVGVVAMAFAAGSAYADVAFLDNFNRTTLGGNYTVTSGVTASMVSDGAGGYKLRLDSATGTARVGASTVGSLIGTPGPGSFIKADVRYGGANVNQLLLNLGGNVAYRATPNYSGYWNGTTWVTGGANAVTADVTRPYILLYSGTGTSGNIMAHLFIDRKWNVTFESSTANLGPSGTAGNLMIQGNAGTSADYGEFDNLVMFRLANNGVGATGAIKAGLALRYSDDFNRPDSSTIGPGWTKQIDTYGSPPQPKGTIEVKNNRLEFYSLVDDSSNWANMNAILDVTNPQVLGRGLRVGEYFEYTVSRPTNHGEVSTEMFSKSMMFSVTGSSRLSAPAPASENFGGQSGYWRPITPKYYNPDSGLTVGARVDYADGQMAIASFYVNGDYVGSWLYNTTATLLNRLRFYAGTTLKEKLNVYDDVKIYGAPAAAVVVTPSSGTVHPGETVTVANVAAPNDAGPADPATLSALAVSTPFSANGTFGQIGLSNGTINAGSSQVGTITFTPAGNLLNGTTVDGTLSYTISALIGATGTGNYSHPLSVTISGNSGNQSSVVPAGGSLDGLSGTSDKELGSIATLLEGTNSGAQTTVAMSWRNRNANEKIPTGTSPPLPSLGAALISDVLDLTGTDGDLFVLQMSYDPNQALPGGAGEVMAAANGWLQLASLDGGLWKNATLANHGPNTGGFFLGSWSAAGSPMGLGSWGVDTTNHVLWAVLDHNSQFAALASVPEPATMLLLALGALGLIALRRFL